MELRISCSSNEIDFETAIKQMPELLDLIFILNRFETMTSCRSPRGDTGLEAAYDLFRAQSKAFNDFLRGLVRRLTAISDVTAQCGFSNTVPCEGLLAKLPPSHIPEPADISIRDIALGRSISEWADLKMRSYQNDPEFRYTSQGQLEQRIWDDLPPELQKWVLKPSPDSRPLGFLRSCFYALQSQPFQTVLCKSLQTMRHNARTDMGNRSCSTCYPNMHRLIHKPRRSLSKQPKMMLQLIRASWRST